MKVSLYQRICAWLSLFRRCKYIIYLLTKKYSVKNNSGFIWNDKEFNIKWNIKKPIISFKDKNLKNFKKL